MAELIYLSGILSAFAKNAIAVYLIFWQTVIKAAAVRKQLVMAYNKSGYILAYSHCVCPESGYLFLIIYIFFIASILFPSAATKPVRLVRAGAIIKAIANMAIINNNVKCKYS